ncbi:hypothetical protein CNEO4_730004 [Clostridium neonatale]|nr:hypothetical protein CNEO2_1090005 [Clostridium neonatale]CAI3693686.1 hypothetical protein CNEO4_730004 [Clostridium neonatale]
MCIIFTIYKLTYKSYNVTLYNDNLILKRCLVQLLIAGQENREMGESPIRSRRCNGGVEAIIISKM